MRLDGLQEEYALDKLLADKCKSPADEYSHLYEEVRELWDAMKDGNKKRIAKKLADVVIVTVILANRLGIDLNKAVYKRTRLNYHRGWLLRKRRKDANKVEGGDKS